MKLASAHQRRRSTLALTIHRIVVSAATAKAKGAAANCAWCRNSETSERSFTCRKGLPMEAETCSQWRDSRKPSSIYEDHRP